MPGGTKSSELRLGANAGGTESEGFALAEAIMTASRHSVTGSAEEE